jgi:hypothetical protein
MLRISENKVLAGLFEPMGQDDAPGGLKILIMSYIIFQQITYY